MQRIICVLIVLAAPLLAAADGDDDVRKELKALEGTWKAVALEAGGKPLPKASVPEFLFIVGADGKATGRMGKIEYQAKVSVDPKKTPKTIDNAHETGAQKGKKQFGIYKVEDGKWIVCMTAPGARKAIVPRPSIRRTPRPSCSSSSGSRRTRSGKGKDREGDYSRGGAASGPAALRDVGLLAARGDDFHRLEFLAVHGLVDARHDPVVALHDDLVAALDLLAGQGAALLGGAPELAAGGIAPPARLVIVLPQKPQTRTVVNFFWAAS